MTIFSARPRAEQLMSISLPWAVNSPSPGERIEMQRKDADSLIPLPTAIVTSHCSLCPQWCPAYRRSSINTCCGGFACGIGAGAVEPECWVQMRPLHHHPLLLPHPTPTKAASSKPCPSYFQHPEAAHLLPPVPHPPSPSPIWTAQQLPPSPPLPVLVP